MSTPTNPPNPGQQPPHQQPPQYQPVGAQQPYPGPGRPAPKKSKKWLWAILGVIVLVIVIAIATGTSEEAENEAAESAPAAAQNGGGDGDAAALNTPVRDGKFEFVVTGVEPGLTEVGSDFMTEKAQGQFVVVDLTVKNTSDKPQSFSPSEQKLKDTEGRTFDSDSSAQIALGDTDIAVWDRINPGNTVSVKLVFDMPKDAEPATLELHDSMFSDGANVSLK